MADTDDTEIPMLSPEDKIIREAKDRFRRTYDWESTARVRFLDDLKFANGDAYNRYQWPHDLYNLRDEENAPCLTVNKTRQHNLQIINDARQNKSAIKISPVGGTATVEAAQVFEGIVRYIEYNSNAQSAYSTATWYQVTAGVGYLRVVREYVADDSFDQDLFIRPVNDPLTILMDPDAKQYDRSDARFAFVFDDMPRDEFNAAYPRYKDLGAQNTIDVGDSWHDLDKDHVRVCEYFRRVEKSDRLLALEHPLTGEVATILESEREEIERFAPELAGLGKRDYERGLKAMIRADREVNASKVEWFLIVGDQVVERSVWPGSTIPIVPVIGEETVIDGQFDRKGHTRALIDPQRMYNYWVSEATAQVAFQTKTPFFAPVGSYENLSEYYETGNLHTAAVLPYNQYDDEGRELRAPERMPPPVMSPAYIQGMQSAATEMAMVSGQYQAEFGAPSNEKSGVAIAQRQRQGDNATYHFIDHFAMAIRAVGRILIEVIPKVYDTPRIVKIMAEDETTEGAVLIDPRARGPLAQMQGAQNMSPEAVAAFQGREGELAAIESIFNPTVGRYDVQADIGPAFGTRRQEAFNALTQLAGQSPELMKIGGDLVLKAADFPFAEELSERWQRTIPPTILGDGPPPDLVEMQQQLAAAQTIIQMLTQKLAEKDEEREMERVQKIIDAHKADTSRLSALKDLLPLAPEDAIALVRNTIEEARSDVPMPDVGMAAAGGLA